MDEPPSSTYNRKPRRLTAICIASLAAALFTPVPATADVAYRRLTPVAAQIPVSTVHSAVGSSTVVGTVNAAAATAAVAASAATQADKVAHSLVSTGMIGIGLAMGGLVIVAHRRRQW